MMAIKTIIANQINIVLWSGTTFHFILNNDNYHDIIKNIKYYNKTVSLGQPRYELEQNDGYIN